MMRYLKWILAGVAALAAVIALIAGFMYIHKTDNYTVKVVAVENSLNEIGRSLERITGVEYVPIEIPVQYQNAVHTQKQKAESTPEPAATDTPVPEETSQPADRGNDTSAATPAPTTVPRATNPPSGSAARTPQPAGTAGTPQPVSTATAPPRPSATDAPGETDSSSDPTPTPEQNDDGDQGGTGEEPHVHTWVTETIPEQGHTESITVEDVEYVTITDEPAYTDDDGNYHPEVTHQEALTTTHTEQVYVVDVPASTRTYCPGCGATQ